MAVEVIKRVIVVVVVVVVVAVVSHHHDYSRRSEAIAGIIVLAYVSRMISSQVVGGNNFVW